MRVLEGVSTIVQLGALVARLSKIVRMLPLITPHPEPADDPLVAPRAKALPAVAVRGVTHARAHRTTPTPSFRRAFDSNQHASVLLAPRPSHFVVVTTNASPRSLCTELVSWGSSDPASCGSALPSSRSVQPARQTWTAAAAATPRAREVEHQLRHQCEMHEMREAEKPRS